MSSRSRHHGLLHALLLAACLLATLWGGGVHRVEHGAVIGVQAAAGSNGQHGHPAQLAHEAHEGHEPGSAECLLIDHALAHADAWLPPLALPFAVLRQEAPEPMAVATVRASAAVPYLARGPPETRA